MAEWNGDVLCVVQPTTHSSLGLCDSCLLLARYVHVVSYLVLWLFLLFWAQCGHIPKPIYHPNVMYQALNLLQVTISWGGGGVGTSICVWVYAVWSHSSGYFIFPWDLLNLSLGDCTLPALRICDTMHLLMTPNNLWLLQWLYFH